MTIDRFANEYKKVKDAMRWRSFKDPLKTEMKDLKGCLQSRGPKSGVGPKLDALRTKLKTGDEAANILTAAGVADGSNKAPTTKQIENVASIKFLRHMYLGSSTGAQTVWVHSSPKAWRKYGWDTVHAAGTSTTSLKSKLADKEEFFDSDTRSKLCEATRLGATWIQKTLLVLSEVKTKTEAREKLDRWFAPAEDDVKKTVKKLEKGFKKMQGTLNDNHVVLTDHPPERGDASKEYTEAYVMVAAHKPKTIYIEQALAKNYDISVLHDMKKNWARVIVHECTHLDLSTTDEQYAWKGIKPGTKITAAQAIKNADSWAFFAADCAGALVAGDITRALNGTGGTATEIASNWN
jgi:hypothetical protein